MKQKQQVKTNESTSGQTGFTGLRPSVVHAIENKLNGWIEDKQYLHFDVTIEKTARQIGTNRCYLSEYINTKYSMIFRQWINQLRIKEAKRFIRLYPNMAIHQIAVKTGFVNSSHFGKVFLAHTRISPQKWRLLPL